MKFFYLYLLAIVVLTPDWARAQFAAERRDLKHHFQIDQIRVFYDTQGRHAVDPADANNNQIPDQVEDIARQTWAAYKIFVEALDFPDPLKSERYKGASFIDVNLLFKQTIGLNGVAYNRVQQFGRPIDKPGTKTICFDVATSVRGHSNITPAHELFHLIQYGATYFQPRWYLEGMARWSEHALRTGGVGRIKYDVRGPWPQTPASAEQLFQMSYDAEFYFWNPLALLNDPRGVIPEQAVHPAVKQLTYANGQKVLQDYNLHGWEFMREVLLELDRREGDAYKALGYANWSLENRRSIRNSPFIYQVVMDVARKRGHRVGPYTATK